ncbi:MAG: hypothetical protein Q9M14_05220 [Mariprofundaceae bacterium]|nr:hypothetical protein [Mariprofundaceae bacterium]
MMMVMIKSKFLCFLIVLLLCSACDSESNNNNTLVPAYPAQESAAFQQFSRQCSSCHRPPMPNAHMASTWPTVVARMQQHKQQHGLLVMRESEKQQVLDYLQTYAKKDVPE